MNVLGKHRLSGGGGILNQIKKHMTTRALFLIMTLMVASSLLAEQKSISLLYDSSDFEFVQTSTGGQIKHVGDNNIAYINPPGAPNLPVHLVMVSVPIEAEFQSVSFSYSVTNFRNDISVSPSQTKVPLSANVDSLQFTPPDPSYYSLSQYPSDPCLYVSTHILRTYKIFCFQVSPFLYAPQSNQLQLITSGTVSFSYSLSYQPNPNRWDDGTRAAMVRELVVNPDEVVNTPSPASEDTDVDYLIITNENWISEDIEAYNTELDGCGYFMPFVEWKTQKGINTKLVSVQSIYSDFPGETPQEKIKRCIEYYYMNKRTNWVLLYGNPEIIPAPLCRVPMSQEEGFITNYCDIETDLYYACFDGNYNWNFDANGFPIHRYSNDVDLLPEVSIGRVACNSFSAYSPTTCMIPKTVSYEKDPPISDFASKALLTGAHMFNQSFLSSPHSDSDLIGEGMWNNYIHPYWSGGIRDRLYDTTSDLGGLSITALSNAIGSGYNVILEYSHGFPQKWAIEWTGNPVDYYWNFFRKLNVPSSNGLQNKYGLLYSIACLTNYFGPSVNETPYPWSETDVTFDTVCLGTEFLNNEGGSVVYIGNTSFGIGNPAWTPESSFDNWGASDDYAKRFFPHLFSGFSDSRTSVGLSFDLSKALMLPAVSAEFNDYETFIMFSLNLQGDPELNILTEDPTAFTVTLPDRLFWDELGVENNISLATGVPFAVVCFTNGEELYEVSSTDANGNVNCTINLVSSNSLTVTITGRNKLPWIEEIPVVPANIKGSVSLDMNPNAVVYTRVILRDSLGNIIAETNPNTQGEFVLGIDPGPTEYLIEYKLLRPDQGYLYYPVASETFSIPDNSTIIDLPSVTLVRFISKVIVSQTQPSNTCFRHIQSAVDCALTYSIPLVQIQSGHYSENILVNPPNRSVPNDLEICGTDLSAIIDGAGNLSDPCIKVLVGEYNPINIKFRNLTIQNGCQGIQSSFTPYVYPGIDTHTTECKVESCLITNNGNTNNSTVGIGVYSDGPITLKSTRIVNNSGIHGESVASIGGGAYLVNNSVRCSTIISDCEFVGNSASQSGGLNLTGTGRYELKNSTFKSNFRRDNPITGFVNNVFCDALPNLDLHRNVFINDVSPNIDCGQNLLIWNCGSVENPATIRNNTISGNLTSLPIDSPGIVIQGADCFTKVENTIIQGSSDGLQKTSAQSQVLMSNCLFWNNQNNFTGFTYDSESSPGCMINVDPLLDTDYIPIWNSSTISPCIDTGLGEDANDGTPADIGAKRADYHQFWEYTFSNQADQEKWYWVSYPVLNRRTDGMRQASVFFDDLLKLQVDQYGNLEPAYLDSIRWVDGENETQFSISWSNQTYGWSPIQYNHNVSSPQGYKIKLLPRTPLLTLRESGFRTPSTTEFTIHGNAENWLGYFLESPAWPHEAFADIWDDINMIKTKSWCLVRSAVVGDYWGLYGKIGKLNYGDMVIVTTNNTHDDFHWNANNDEMPSDYQATPEQFVYDEKQDYTPVFITIPTDAMVNLKEIGLYLDGVCKGAVVVENELEQICAYLGIDEKLSEGVVDFVFYYDDNKAQHQERKTIRMNSDRFSANYVSGNRRYVYYDLAFSKEDIENAVTPEVHLNQNYPNPFNPSTMISYSLPEAGQVKLEIFNLRGQLVSVLTDSQEPAGEHHKVWNGTDQSGNTVASGVYFYRLITPARSICRRMLLMK